MSQEHQEPQGHAPAPFEPFTGKMTKTQAGILRTLWDLETGQGQLSNLRHGLHSSAAKLVERGLIWKKDRWPARPVYGITPAGIPAALEAWREVYPQRAQAEIEARCQQPLPPAVRPIVEEALATGDLVKANEALHRLSGGKTIQQVADDWAGQIQTAAEPEQREQQQPDPQLPPAKPRPSRPAEGQTYTQRVWTAYRSLADEMQTPDVPIHAIHRRVGGSLLELQNHLRAECLAHRAVASTGEPAFAGDAARQSALWLPGETDRATGKPQSFLLIKLIDQPPMTQQPPPPQEAPPQPTAAQPEIGRRLTRDDLAVIIEALEYRCDAIEGGTDFDEVARLKSIAPTLEKLRAIEAQPQRPEHERYESLLRATAALRYPAEERTAELETRIEKTIARKVGEFTQERRAKAYEAGLRKELAQRHPNLTPDQAQRYERRINELVAEFRQNQTQQQQAQPPPAHSQEQGRGIER